VVPALSTPAPPKSHNWPLLPVQKAGKNRPPGVLAAAGEPSVP